MRITSFHKILDFFSFTTHTHMLLISLKFNQVYSICSCFDLRLHMFSNNKYVFDVFRGMTVTSGSVVLSKDEKNLIGISIGGGAPLCPCLYIVQVITS